MAVVLIGTISPRFGVHCDVTGISADLRDYVQVQTRAGLPAKLYVDDVTGHLAVRKRDGTNASLLVSGSAVAVRKRTGEAVSLLVQAA